MKKDLIALTALEDAISVLNEITKKRRITNDILIHSELIVTQFKEDFRQDIEFDKDGQLRFSLEQ